MCIFKTKQLIQNFTLFDVCDDTYSFQEGEKTVLYTSSKSINRSIFYNANKLCNNRITSIYYIANVFFSKYAWIEFCFQLNFAFFSWYDFAARYVVTKQIFMLGNFKPVCTSQKIDKHFFRLCIKRIEKSGGSCFSCVYFVVIIFFGFA